MLRAAILAFLLGLVPAGVPAGTSHAVSGGVTFADATAEAGIGLAQRLGRHAGEVDHPRNHRRRRLPFRCRRRRRPRPLPGQRWHGLADFSAAPASPGRKPRDAFYLNQGGGRFREATAEAGLGDERWGGGCAAADADNDGDTDVYVTNFGGDVFYRNDGRGHFADATVAAGLTDSKLEPGRGLFDADHDGDLDLYVANYLEFDPSDPALLARRCRWKSGQVMCGPRGFVGEADVFYKNRGDGSFANATAVAGLGDALYGMGVVAGDLDGDGDVDLFVANDSQQNLLLANDGTGRFRDVALEAGVALAGDGRSQAGMGADLGDFDGDGDEDLLVTNFSDDYHTLYRNDGDFLFTDVSASAGLDPATRFAVGWAGLFFDFDNDGDLDIFFANGHVYPGVESFDPATSYRQRNQLFENDGRGHFRDLGGEAGAALLKEGNGRGVAAGDIDDDGDLDLVVVNSDDLPLVLRNEGGNRKHFLQVELVGSKSPRDGNGTRLRLVAGGRRQLREARSAAGYLSSNDSRIHFGLGESGTVEQLELRWPSGREQKFENLPADCLLTIDEERGVVGKQCRPRPTGAAPAAAAAPAPAPPPTVAPAPAASLPAGAAPPVKDQLLREAQGATRAVLAGRYALATGAFEKLLAGLPPWEAAKASPDAFGFGQPEAYRGFLAAVNDNLGVAYLRSERFDACALAVGKALELEPQSSKFHHNLGLCLLHSRRYAEAAEVFRKAAALPSPSSEVGYDLGRALAGAAQCEEAEKVLTAALAELKRPDPRGRDAESYYLRGGCRADRGLLAEAEDDLREALALVPGHQKSFYKLAGLLAKRGKREAAAAARAAFLERQRNDEAAQALKRSGLRDRSERLRLAEAYLAAGQPTQAYFEAQTLLEADPRDPAALTLLGEARLGLEPPAAAAAAEAFRQAIAIDLNGVRAKAGLALAEARQSSTPARRTPWPCSCASCSRNSAPIRRSSPPWPKPCWPNRAAGNPRPKKPSPCWRTGRGSTAWANAATSKPFSASAARKKRGRSWRPASS